MTKTMPWLGLPGPVLTGPLSYLSARKHLPLAIIGPGPSIQDIDPAHIPDEVVRFRMNMFFTEPEPRFGRRVDGYFWANDLDVMYELMQSTFESGAYDYKLFFTPNEIKPERPDGKAVADRCRAILHPRYDHWWLIGHHPAVVRNMLLRPLPTQTFQALATALILGFKEIHLIGIDMYRNKGQRYAYKYSNDIKDRLDEKHQKPGYEGEAHSERRDLAFLDHLLACFPDAKVYNASSVSPLREVLPDSVLMRGVPIKVNQHADYSLDLGLTDPESEVIRLEAEVAALRASRSFRLGQALFKPLALVRNGLSRRRQLKTASETTQPQQTSVAEGAATQRPQLSVVASAVPPTAKEPDQVEVLAICHEAHSKTGGYRPIKNYIEATSLQGRNTHLLNLMKLDASKKGDVTIPKAKSVVINSFAALEWEAVQKFLATEPENVSFYLHEMGWLFERLRENDPQAYNRVASVLSKFPVLCVSKIQQSYVDATFSPPNSTVIYNVTADGNLDPSAAYSRLGRQSEVKTILMIGTIQKRKGPELFGQIADMAREQRLPLRFLWAGHQTEDVGPLSSNVEWLGFQKGEALKSIIRNADAFLLSSWDDPFPLSCLEALSWGVPVVSFRNSGVCEIIEGMPGCGVFETRDPADALDVLTRALDEKVDPMRLFFHARPFVDANYFVLVLDEALSVDQQAEKTSTHHNRISA